MMLWGPILLGIQLTDQEQAIVEGIYNRYQEMIMRRLRRTVQEQDREDVFANVFKRLIKKLELYMQLDEQQQRAYIYSVTKYVILDYYRKQQKDWKHRVDMPEERLQQIADPAGSLEEKLIFEEQAQAVNRAIGRLPQEQQQLLEMRHTQKCSWKEMAEQLQISPDAARKRVKRIQDRLGKMLKEEEE